MSNSISIDARASWLPLVWALGWVVLFASALYSVSWPSDDLSTTLAEAAGFDWRQTFALAFGPDVEFRPLFHLATNLAYELFGLRVAPYETVVLVQFAVVLALAVWLCRPFGARRACAACIAISCIAGLHTSRILFAFPPINAGAFVLILVLLEIGVAFDSRTVRSPWIFLPFVVLAMLWLEWGVVAFLIVPVLWAVRAPGVSRSAFVWAACGVGVYLALRILSGSVGRSVSFHTESGFGFSQLSPQDLETWFGGAPWLFWAYNVMATFLTVVASEPRSGVFAFVSSLVEGNVPYWRWVHVISSLLTTAVIAGAVVFCRQWSFRDRLLCTAGLALLVFGSALGLPYTRDRMGMLAGVGYGLLVYLSLATLLERPIASRSRWMAVACVALIGAAWVIRSGETYFQLRDTAWDFHRQWEERAAEFEKPSEQDPFLTRLRHVGLSRIPEDPRQDPTWAFVLFERRFPINAARPLSPPFDIRWRPEISDAERQRRENELGLTNREFVRRDARQRTWSYRLRRPTRLRVSAILNDAAVEDTARIDRERLEIIE